MQFSKRGARGSCSDACWQPCCWAARRRLLGCMLAVVLLGGSSAAVWTAPQSETASTRTAPRSSVGWHPRVREHRSLPASAGNTTTDVVADLVQLRGQLLRTIEGDWSGGAVTDASGAPALSCGLPRDAALSVQVQQDGSDDRVLATWEMTDINKTGRVMTSYQTELFFTAIQRSSRRADDLEANLTVCLRNVSTIVRVCENGGVDQGATWQRMSSTYCRDKSPQNARCCSQGALKISHLRHKIDLRMSVPEPIDPSSDVSTRALTPSTTFDWKRAAIEARTFAFDYCSCDNQADGLGVGVCPSGSITVSEAMAWHCEASIAASDLQVESLGSLLRCPALSPISFKTRELGTMTVDLSVTADSNWVAANGCYGLLRCVAGPCEDGQETAEEQASRCLPRADSPISASAAIKFVFPNTGATQGGDVVTLVGACLEQMLSAPSPEAFATAGSFPCTSTQVISPTRLACVLGPGFGAQRKMSLRLGPSKTEIPCSDASNSRCWVHFRPPEIFSNLPTLVSVGGGRQITILGRNFGHPRESPSLEMRVVVAGQLCVLDKSLACPACGYNIDGVIVCVLAANMLKVATQVSLEVAATGVVRHDCSACPAGYRPRGTPPDCQCVAEGVGGEVYHMPSWGKLVLWLDTRVPTCSCSAYDMESGATDDPQAIRACEAAGDGSGCKWAAGYTYGGYCQGTCVTAEQAAGVGSDGRVPLNLTLIGEKLARLLDFPTSEQLLFAPQGYDISESGVLVRAPVAGQGGGGSGGDGDGENSRVGDAADLETRTLQVLASPTERTAHVTALYTLAAAAQDGRLRAAAPQLRRISIRQLRADDYEVQESKAPSPPPPPSSSALWVPIVIGGLLFLLPSSSALLWCRYQLPVLRNNARAVQKMKKFSARGPVLQGEGEMEKKASVSGQKFGSPNAKTEFSSRAKLS